MGWCLQPCNHDPVYNKFSLSSLSFCFLQISKQQLQTVKDRFQAFLNGETQIVADEAFMNAVQSYYEVRTTL
jgi:hypothetical protein